MSDLTTNLDLVIQASSGKEIQINGLADAASPAMLFGRRQSTCAGLNWGFYGGRFDIAGVSTAIANGIVALTASSTNYVIASKATGVVTASTVSTNWLSSAYKQLYICTTSASSVTNYVDYRCAQVVPSNIVAQNIQSTSYVTVLSDAGKHILHPSDDTTARTFTIDSNANVPYDIGTCITFVNQAAAGTLSIAIATDTMRLAGAGTLGTRTLTANGIATAIKITSTEWIISGVNLT